MDRGYLQQLARVRIREAKALLDNKLYSGAYYIAGYSIECAFKACIAKKMKKNVFPDKKFAEKCYTHNLKDLIKLADLEIERAKLEGSNATFATNWGVVKDWDESSRYKLWTEAQAKDLVNSIVSRNYGILKWIRQYW